MYSVLRMAWREHALPRGRIIVDMTIIRPWCHHHVNSICISKHSLSKKQSSRDATPHCTGIGE